MRGFPEMTDAERAFAREYEADAIADSARDMTPNMHHGSGRLAEQKNHPEAPVGSGVINQKAA